MNLCDRLQRPTPCGYGQRYYFKYFDGFGWDKFSLIFLVVERYGQRFGPVSEGKANALYSRLAGKYCLCRLSYRRCFQSLLIERDHNKPDIYFAHPAEARKKSEAIKSAEFWKIEGVKVAKKMVEDATKYAHGPFAFTNSTAGVCRLCGGCVAYMLYSPSIYGGRKFCNADQNGFHSVCRRPMCKAIAKKFPLLVKPKSSFPMAKILMEITKNGDRNSIIRELKEIASRDIYATHNRRSRKKAGKDSGATCA